MLLTVANMKRRPPIQVLLLVNRFLAVVIVVLAFVVGGVSSEYHEIEEKEAATANANEGQRLLRGGITTAATAILQDMENASAGQRVAIMKEFYGDAYVGCYLEGLSAVSLETDDVAACLIHCLEKDYAFAAIQTLTECSCSNDYSIFGTPASSDEDCERAAVGTEVGGTTANFVFATKHTSATTPRRAIFASLMAWLKGGSHVSGTDAPTEDVGSLGLTTSLLSGATGLATQVPTYDLTIDGSEYSDAPTPSPNPKKSGKSGGKPDEPCDDKEKKGVLHKIGSLLFGPSKAKSEPKPETADVVETIENEVNDLLGVTSAPSPAVTDAVTDGGAAQVEASVIDTFKDKVGNIFGLGTDAPSGVGAPVQASVIGTIKDKIDDILGVDTLAPTSGGTVEATFDASGADLSEAPTPSPVAKKPKGPKGGHSVKPPPGVKLSGNPGAQPKPKSLSPPPPNVKLTGNPEGQKILPKLGSSQAAYLMGDGLNGVTEFVNQVLDARGEAYMGCYKDVPLLQAMHFGSHSNHNIGTCRAYCLEEGYDYAGLREGHLCFCDNCYEKYGKADEDDDCDKECTMSGGHAGDVCGGMGYLSVYASREKTPSPTHSPTVTPSPTGDSDLTEAHRGYRGCYFDNSTVPVMNHKSGSDHSISSCIEYCKDKDDDYAGLKGGKECYCANIPNSTGAEPDDSLCNIGCTQGGGGICGGEVGLSVFSTEVEESRD